MFTPARDYLAKFGISMDVALSFIAGNIGQPAVIYEVCKGGGLTTRMVAEIIQQAVPEIGNDVVKAYFANAGLDHVALDQPDIAAVKVSGSIVRLTAGNDNFTGTGGMDIVDAGLGDDVVSGQEGPDYLFGDGGNDTIYGGSGVDHIEGGGGNDTLYGFAASYSADDRASSVILGDAGADKIYGGNGDDRLYGGDGADTIEADSSEFSEGPYGNDWVSGGTGDDNLRAGSGFDTLLGGEGNDIVSGGGFYGRDVLDGGVGNDTIYFGQGDQVTAGSGDDRIFYDTISSLGRLQYDPSNAGRSLVVAGDGADQIVFSAAFNTLLAASKVTIDLREAVRGVDTIGRMDFQTKPVSPALEIIGFDVGSDKIEINDFDLYGTTSGDDQVKSTWGYNFAQILTSPQEGYRPALDSGKLTADDHGKGFFVIQGASAAAADTGSVARLIDAYGADASYGKSDAHYFLVNIGDKDCGLYLFTDDTGADNQIIADELTPVLLLGGVRTEAFSSADLAYTFI